MRTLFVANRGEIARRIARTCDRLGIAAVAARTSGPAAVDLLDVRAVVEAAASSGADAVHPGFGFLAEDPRLAEAVVAAGMRWVGPPASAMRAMGDKAGARRLAASLGVPVLPGYDGANQADQVLLAAARRIGGPLLVKPSGGGGGKGMRVVRDLAAFPDALAASRREAAAAFADDRVVLERYVEGPRHVEVQVLFDRYGHGLHLGERDCSSQRRHQKVLEETPSPAVDPPLRERLAGAAMRLASAVDYESAGTVEFLVAGDDFWFLEMNTRLQVEHPVTEMTTGRDLVEDQLRIAAGEPLETGRSPVRATGHAIEVRLYAEDPDAGFLPATGRVLALRWPGGDGIRVDAGIDAGDEVGARFDPLLAKVVAWGRDRPAALGRLAAALDDTLVLGVTTNLSFLRWLVRQPWIVAGDARVDTLEAAWAAARNPPGGGGATSGAGSAGGPGDEQLPRDAWEVACRALIATTADAWAGGWRLGGPAVLRLAAGGAVRRVEIDPVGGDRVPPRAVAVDGSVAFVDVDGRSVEFRLAPAPDVDAAARGASSRRGRTTGGGTSQVIAPMPGSVVAIHVEAGRDVEAGDPVVTLEAMKMEHVVAAPTGGRLTGLAVARGAQVVRGQLLAVVEPDVQGGDALPPSDRDAATSTGPETGRALPSPSEG